MDRKQLKQLIRKYETGKATKAERHIVDSWYNSILEDRGSYADFNSEAYRSTLEKKWLKALYEKKMKPTLIYRHWWAAAAIFLVILSAALLLSTYERDSSQQQQSAQVFTTIPGQIKKLFLPDSTVIYLHSNSTLTIPDGFASEHRDIILDGEAFFEVARNEALPCVVQTNAFRIEVLGTSFNVLAYPGFERSEVTVATGKVAVRDTLNELTVLRERERLTHQHLSGERTKTSISAGGVAVWREGRQTLRQGSFSELALALQNQYGVILRSDNLDVLTANYNLVIRREQSIDQVLKQISKMTNRNYRKEGMQITIL